MYRGREEEERGGVGESYGFQEIGAVGTAGELAGYTGDTAGEANGARIMLRRVR